jgi:DNA-binding ferritin-like protein (Dps family)
MTKTKSLIKQLNKASENLSEENKNIFTDIVVYIRMSNIKIKDSEEFLQQILDSFLNAEQQGVSIENVLGTPDIKHYCEDIVNTYKSSYNYLSLCSDYVMHAGSILIILSIINYISQNLIIIIKYGFNDFTFHLNFSLGMLFQYLLISLIIIIIFSYAKKTCFKQPIKSGKIKEFLKLWGISCLWISIPFACMVFLDKILLFRLNIFIFLIIGLVLYFSGNYFSEK